MASREFFKIPSISLENYENVMKKHCNLRFTSFQNNQLGCNFSYRIVIESRYNSIIVHIPRK